MKVGVVSKVKSGFKIALVCLLAVLVLLQLGLAGFKLFYDLKYHRPLRLQSYLVFDELIPCGAPEKLTVAGASWHERKLVEEAYRSIDLPLDSIHNWRYDP